MAHETLNLINAFPLPCLIVDAEKKVIHLNKWAASILNAEPNNIIGTSIFKWIPHLPKNLCLDESGDFKLSNGENNKFTGSVSSFFYYDDAQAFLITLTPPDKEKQEIQLLEKKVGELRTQIETQKAATNQLSERSNLLLGNLSHKLRTPLNAIIGYAEMLQEESSEMGLETMTSDLNQIKNAAIALLEVTRRVLDFSKLEAGTFQLKKIDVDADALIRSIIHDIQFKKNNLETNLQNNLGLLHIDPERFYDAVMLILLALDKHTSNGQIQFNAGRLIDTGSSSGEDIFEIEIQVVGKTLDHESLQTLLNPFEPKGLEKNAYNITDLELIMGYRLVKQMGGEITIDTDPEKSLTLKIVFSKI